MLGILRERQHALEAVYPKWEPLTLYQMLLKNAEKCPSAPFLLTEKNSLTYWQTLGQVQQTVRGLQALGVRHGTRVAVALGNCPEYVFLTFALSALGAIKVPVNIELGKIEQEDLLRHMDPSLLIVRAGDGIELYPCQGGQPHGLSWKALTSMGTPAYTPAGPVSPDDICDIIYTSGSSGTPKGVLLTSDMLLRSAFGSCLNRGFELGRRIFVPLPLFHVYGYVEGLLAALLAEGAVILPKGHFSPEETLKLMHLRQANDLLCVPGMMRKLLQSPALSRTPLHTLHAVYCSASAYPSWLWRAVHERLGISDIITGYGMTETAGAALQTAPGDAEQTVLRRVGRILSGGCAGSEAYGGALLEYRIADPATGAVLIEGETGELQCRGLTVSHGYYHNEEADAAAFTPDGWLRTGDLGRFDENGYLELLGRKCSRYKCNGENVSPEFVARILEQCPLVAHAEVVGIPDDKTGETGAAFIELLRDANPDGARETLRLFCKAHLARFQMPKAYYFLKNEDWPLTAAGKISRRALRETALHSAP